MRPHLFRELDVDALIGRAIEQQERAGDDGALSFVVELHQRPSRATFDAAALVGQGGARRGWACESSGSSAAPTGES